MVEDFIIAACAVEMVGEAGSCTGAFWAQARRATLIPFSVKLFSALVPTYRQPMLKACFLNVHRFNTI